MSALQRAVGVLLLLVAWRAVAVPRLLEALDGLRAKAPPAQAGPSGGQTDPNWTAPLGRLLTPEQRTRGAELARALPPASPVPGADPELEPELLALTRLLLDRIGVGAPATPTPEAEAGEGDPWHGVEPRERLRLLRALVEDDALDGATEAALLEGILAHIVLVQGGVATK